MQCEYIDNSASLIEEFGTSGYSNLLEGKFQSQSNTLRRLNINVNDSMGNWGGNTMDGSLSAGGPNDNMIRQCSKANQIDGIFDVHIGLHSYLQEQVKLLSRLKETTPHPQNDYFTNDGRISDFRVLSHIREILLQQLEEAVSFVQRVETKLRRLTCDNDSQPTSRDSSLSPDESALERNTIGRNVPYEDMSGDSTLSRESNTSMETNSRIEPEFPPTFLSNQENESVTMGQQPWRPLIPKNMRDFLPSAESEDSDARFNQQHCYIARGRTEIGLSEGITRDSPINETTVRHPYDNQVDFETGSAWHGDISRGSSNMLRDSSSQIDRVCHYDEPFPSQDQFKAQYNNNHPQMLKFKIPNGTSTASLRRASALQLLEHRRKNKGKQHMASSEHACSNCRSRITPQWRFLDNDRYCNACYMRHKRSLSNLPPSISENHRRSLPNNHTSIPSPVANTSHDRNNGESNNAGVTSIDSKSYCRNLCPLNLDWNNGGGMNRLEDESDKFSEHVSSNASSKGINNNSFFQSENCLNSTDSIFSPIYNELAASVPSHYLLF